MNPNELVPTLDNGYIIQNLLKPDYNKFVWDYMGNFNQLTFFASRPGNKRQAPAKWGEVHDKIMELPVVQAVIASIGVISSTSLQVNFTNPTFGFIPTGNVTNNFALNTRAIVTYVDPNNNYIIINSADDAQILNSGDWAVGTWITQEYNTQPRESTGTPSTYYVPSDTFNYCTKMRLTLTINLEDDEATWVVGDDGNNYFYMAQEKLNVEEFFRKKELNALKGELALWTPNGTPSNGGVMWAIKDELRGGVWNPYLSPPALSDFTSWLDECANRTNTPIYEMTVFAGRGAIETFQNWTENYILYAGMRNTFGGADVMGIDVMEWAAGNIRLKILPLSSLNSQDYFKNPSAIMPGSVEYNTMIALDFNPLGSVGASMKQSPLQYLYQGKTDAMTIKYMPGVVPESLMDKQTGNIAVTDGDNFTIQWLDRSGINLMARNSGAFMPAS